VAHREHLEAAGVGDDRPAPGHELVQAAHLGDVVLTGRDEQVEGVAQHHRVTQVGHLGGAKALDRAAGGQRDERRRRHVAVMGVDDAGARGPVARLDFERMFHGRRA
jgi:hypothetical protein